jgi:hypothetical protein
MATWIIDARSPETMFLRSEETRYFASDAES